MEMDLKVQRKFTLLRCVQLGWEKYYRNTVKVKTVVERDCSGSTVP